MKKSISILLAIILVAVMGVPAFASATQKEGGSIVLRYTAINSIRAYISMSGSTATSVANLSHTGAKATVKLVLQRSTNGGKSYSDYSTLSNKSYTTKIVTAEASKSGLTTGASYKYRTKAVITVFDSNGKQIDSGTAYS